LTGYVCTFRDNDLRGWTRVDALQKSTAVGTRLRLAQTFGPSFTARLAPGTDRQSIKLDAAPSHLTWQNLHLRRCDHVPPGLAGAARAADLPNVHAFTRGLDLDIDAAIAAVTLPFHNGQTEGVNTKTKLIKRQMYGRAGYTLLRHRILLT
jgi:Transposase